MRTSTRNDYVASGDSGEWPLPLGEAAPSAGEGCVRARTLPLVDTPHPSPLPEGEGAVNVSGGSGFGFGLASLERGAGAVEGLVQVLQQLRRGHQAAVLGVALYTGA